MAKLINIEGAHYNPEHITKISQGQYEEQRNNKKGQLENVDVYTITIEGFFNCSVLTFDDETKRDKVYSKIVSESNSESAPADKAK